MVVIIQRNMCWMRECTTEMWQWDSCYHRLQLEFWEISLLYYHLVLYCNECTFRFTDFSQAPDHSQLFGHSGGGFPQTMTAFGLKDLFSDFGDTLTLYIQWVGKSASISIACLVSDSQNIKIGCMNSCWKYLKGKAPSTLASLFPSAGSCT